MPDFYPIPKSTCNLLDQGLSGNFSLYFQRMVVWNDDAKLKAQYISGHDRNNRPEYDASIAKIFKNRLDGKPVLADSSVLDKVHARQHAMLTGLALRGAPVFEFRATLVSPYISGLGSGHPTEAGMILDRNTGVPFIPASGIKGVLRLARALDIAENNPDLLKKDSKGEIVIPDKEPSLCRYFGDTESGDNSCRGQLLFLDAFPAKVPEIKIDIMNPHYGKYYQGGDEGPLETENPIPVKFLATQEGTEFVFRCYYLPLMGKNNSAAQAWTDEDSANVKAMFDRALSFLGMGSKTAAGYGRFGGVESCFDFEKDVAKARNEIEAQHKAYQEKIAQEEEAKRIAELSPDDRVKDAYKKAGNLSVFINEALSNTELSKEFFCWLKKELQARKEWKTEGNPAKDKIVKRSLAVQAKIEKMDSL